MEMFKYAIVVMALDEMQREREQHGQRRQMTPAELDALADYGWHLPDLKGALATGVNAVRVRWRPQASHRIEPTPLPSAAAPSHG
jgi:hypothetical protein